MATKNETAAQQLANGAGSAGSGTATATNNTDTPAAENAAVNGESASMQSAHIVGDFNKSNYMKKNTKDYKTLSYFIAGIDVTDQNLDQLTPYIPGIARLFMHKEPVFMQVAFPTETDNFKSYIETGYKSISGIEDLSATAESIQGGWANQSYEVLTSVEDQTNTLTIGLYEQTGSPVREFLELWLTGIRDPRSGVAHYHGVVETPDRGTGQMPDYGTYANMAGFNGRMENGVLTDTKQFYVPYCERNHTAEFVYYDLDPTAHYIEYACMFAHAFPKSVKKDHLNYSSGERSPVEMSVDFSVAKYESRYINDLAIHYLIKDQLEYNYLNFNPFYKQEHDKANGAGGETNTSSITTKPAADTTDDYINYNLELAHSTSTASQGDAGGGAGGSGGEDVFSQPG